ncbi:MAG: trypsin-like peptidase domain-containing protein [Planctomycetes bacterium]|nr:trypsin-like peptidase domain-containing protein [Planctomycetota bacterium]MBZ0151191.1 trypsin-like peptidase domain-containing protein [Planctomycetota bacterium]MCC7398500.1 trypsin-like peptidase domain-containing protein [Planctomycetota bacterium]
MKRTLVEVFCGLAALVLMVSFHHQIARLETRQQDVGALEKKLDAAVAKVGDTHEFDQMRQQILAETESRIRALEKDLHQAAAGSEQAGRIADDLQRAKQDVALFRSQLSNDFDRTKALVDAYINEVRKKEQDAATKLGETQVAIALLANQLYRDPKELTRTMLSPTVQLNGEDTVGSGTVVFSGPNPKNGDKVETYVLTSNHVVRNILADTPKAQREGFDVTIYLPDGKLVVKGRAVASEPKIDAALIKLETDRVLPNVANVLPRDETGQIKVWDPVCAVGCPLGNDPVPSQGEISSLHNELNGSNYWMINAPTYFGNSGGGIYRANTRQLIGVFSKIYTHGKGTPVVVPHMGLCTPMTLVYDWLDREKLAHLLQSRPVEIADLSQLATPMK